MSNFAIHYFNYFFIGLMVIIMLYDFFTMTIPNWLNALILIGFIVAAYFTNMAWGTIGWHVLAAVITLLIGFLFFAANLFGGGDAKSIAVIALWFGWSLNTPSFLLMMAVFGGLFAVLLLIIRFIKIGDMLPEKVAEIGWVKAIVTPETRMPYGVAIGAAAIVIYSPQQWLA